MIDKIISFSLNNKLIIILLVVGLIVWGGYSLTQLPVDAVPDITDNQVRNASKRMMNSAVFGQIIILIVYLPILTMVGIEGKMFGPMAQTVSFAIIGALILSLTYVPVMSFLFLSRNTEHKENVSDKIINFIHKLYNPIILFALRRKYAVLILSLFLFAASLVAFSNIGGEFIPTLEEGDFAIETRVLTGSSLFETIEASNIASAILLENFPEVKEVVGKIGSGEIPTDPMPIATRKPGKKRRCCCRDRTS